MLAFGSIIACLSLLGIAVLVLHSHQLRAASNSAERSIPLMTHGRDFDLQSLEVSDDRPPTPTDNTQVIEIGLHFLKPSEQELLFAAAPPRVSIESKPKQASTENLNNISHLSNNEEKISQGDQELPQYPLLGAYTQSCIHLRKRLKTISANPELFDTTLQILYRTAAVAELLHSKKSQGKLALGQLKMLPEELIAELDMPYGKLGYTELTLLRKSDIKRLLLLWGKPETHQCPRNYHRQRWQAICQRFG